MKLDATATAAATRSPRLAARDGAARVRPHPSKPCCTFKIKDLATSKTGVLLDVPVKRV